MYLYNIMVMNRCTLMRFESFDIEHNREKKNISCLNIFCLTSRFSRPVRLFFLYSFNWINIPSIIVNFGYDQNFENERHLDLRWSDHSRNECINTLLRLENINHLTVNETFLFDNDRNVNKAKGCTITNLKIKNNVFRNEHYSVISQNSDV